MSKRTNRELVMLAQKFNPAADRIAGMYLSEKLDGMRCLWLPATQGRKVADLPFANRMKDSRDHTATGLWTRYGKVIHCPPEFVFGFPDVPLDGELFAGRGDFQTLMSISKTLVPDPNLWHRLRYMVFDAPRYTDILASGNVVCGIQFKAKYDLFTNLNSIGVQQEPGEPPIFDFVYKRMRKNLSETQHLRLHEQILLPFNTPQAREILEEKKKAVDLAGGEGLMLRHPASPWEPIRSKFLMKVKTMQDAEGVVVGMTWGKGKYEGMMGSLRIKWEHGEFDLSGFTDEERRGNGASEGSGEWMCYHFKIGDTVTFKYRELTNDNHPKEARYWRKFG